MKYLLLTVILLTGCGQETKFNDSYSYVKVDVPEGDNPIMVCHPTEEKVMIGESLLEDYKDLGYENCDAI